jgi:hypothetical protein
MHATTWYFLATLVAWIPAAFALRAAGTQGRLEQLVGGLLVALAWPLSLPALFVSMVRTEDPRGVATSR